MFRYIYIIMMNFIFCLGIESISLPNNALEIASANSGIGNSKNMGLNFSSINNTSNSINVSSILWYQGVKGGNIEYKWGQTNHHYLSLYNLSADNIDLRYITPSDKPVDVFDIHHISLAYGFGKIVSNNFRIGIKSTIIYNQLYTDESFGYNFDLGVSYDYNKFMSLGIIINQLGSEKIDHSFINYPLLGGFGITLSLESLQSKIHSDIIYNNSFNNELTFKVASVTQFPYIDIIAGYSYSSSKSEFSCGLSFKYRKIQFDYGISFHNALGSPTIFSLKYHI